MRLIAKQNREAFWQRFEKDGAAAMDKDRWAAWIDALPRPEFFAMVDVSVAAPPVSPERE